MTRRVPHLRAALVGFAAVTFGCQLLVSSDVPDFRCVGDDPLSCPSGTTCDPSVGRCVTPEDRIDSGREDTFRPDGSDATTSDQDAGPPPLGSPCRVDGDCASGLCGSSTILTTTITQNRGPMCTTACCTSNDCPSGFVCFGSGTGGSYCVPADRAGRMPPASGGAASGAACSVDEDCRSGLCEVAPDGGPSACLDTCCSQAECAPGSVCRVKRVSAPAPSHDVWVCAAPEEGALANPSETCTDNLDCTTDVCVGAVPPRQCRPPCCGTASCVALGFGAGHCVYGTSNNDYFKFCFFTTNTSRAPVGANCENDSECQSDFCDAELKKCSDICCTQTDCPPDHECRPSAVGTPYLRCVAK